LQLPGQSDNITLNQVRFICLFYVEKYKIRESSQKSCILDYTGYIGTLNYPH